MKQPKWFVKCCKVKCLPPGEFDILFEHDDNDDDNIAFPDVGDVSFDGIDGGGLGDVNVYDEDGLVMEPPKVQETIVELPKYAKQV